ncbi:hypothetical protein DM02DRAFT_670096 [Periconia macrospinosa]|uniref:RNase H type-1 domain-containing protein n=1 Tax=Periconia macrospinosa TaxID=97972 RepID=A0A2V1DYK3_9PLEO|nr:hypothetical protein DM02DRAFT_670096 [Periconia macrospinosa]
MEPIPPFITPPWRQGPEIRINKDAETARRWHDKENATNRNISIYIDSSRIDSRIGAAAVCPPSSTSAAAIWSIAKAEGRTGAYILEEIARQVQDLQDKGRPVQVRWVPAHVGIPGNEAADRAAKAATGWGEDGTRDNPPRHPLSCTHSGQRYEGNVKRRQRYRGGRDGEEKPRAERPSRTRQHPQRRYSSYTKTLRRGKAPCSYSFLYSRNVPVAHVLHCRKHKDLRTILNKPRLATKAIKFIVQTQILGQFRITDA